MSKISSWIMQNNLRRWLLFLPASIICAFIVALIIEIIAGIVFTQGNGSIADFIGNLFRYVFEGFFCGLIFTYVGGYIAPNKVGRILLITILIGLALIQIFSIFTLNQIDYWTILFSVLLLTGGYVANQQLIEEKLN